MKRRDLFSGSLFANGVSIHADDFDDTQLAAARDRICGLLTHPTVAVLPPAFALCEVRLETIAVLKG